MIADALQAEVLAGVVRARRENPLLVRAARGTLSPEQIVHYLVNVHRLVENTPTFLAKAESCARAAGDLRLAEHFLHKAEEEEGHAQWALDDLATMANRVSGARRDVVPALEEWTALMLSVCDEDPALSLVYIFFNESLMIMVGDETLSNLESRCGIPRSSMTIVDHHVKLDRDHVDEALAVIDALIPDPSKLPRMREFIRECFAVFQRFGQQIAEANDDRYGELSVHAPAA